LDYVRKHPNAAPLSDGIQWGKRLSATEGVATGAFVGPVTFWDPLSETLMDRLELCAQMLENDTANAIMVPVSVSKRFRMRPGKCDNFVESPELMVSQMAAAPHFILPWLMVRESGDMLQSWNVASKHVSGLGKYQKLEQKYLGTLSTCPPSAASSTQITLYSQSGAALVWHSTARSC
jgi:hypothetical protein